IFNLHNIYISTYTTSNNVFKYIFSIILYIEKFMCKYHEKSKQFRKRMNRIIDCSNLNLDLLSDIHLYKSIEKRGFRINVKGSDLSWQSCLLFAFQKLTEKSTLDYVETQNQK